MHGLLENTVCLRWMENTVCLRRTYNEARSNSIYLNNNVGFHTECKKKISKSFKQGHDVIWVRLFYNGGAYVLSRVQLLWPHGLYSTRLFCPQNFPGKNAWVGCHFLLQGIFPTQESNPSLASPAVAADSLPLCHLGIRFLQDILLYGREWI